MPGLFPAMSPSSDQSRESFAHPQRYRKANHAIPAVRRHEHTPVQNIRIFCAFCAFRVLERTRLSRPMASSAMVLRSVRPDESPRITCSFRMNEPKRPARRGRPRSTQTPDSAGDLNPYLDAPDKRPSAPPHRRRDRHRRRDPLSPSPPDVIVERNASDQLERIQRMEQTDRLERAARPERPSDLDRPQRPDRAAARRSPAAARNVRLAGSTRPWR